ncbi:hypothetical protein AB0D10_15610 [Kitasatospora sp. NPDC048545]|uniref:hypothetical protein n=1 Tax=Kitasatospora sp. NPDC048545 TaxID=3157208 RepID=UPI00340F6486
MAVPRNLLAVALLACGTAAVVTGCTPAESRPTVAAASAAAVADEAADDFLDEDYLLDDEEYGVEGEDGEEAYAPAEDPSATADAPSAAASTACTAPAELPGHEVLVVVSASTAELTARPARHSCGPARYTATGSAVHYGFSADGVTATLVDRSHGDPARPVPLEDLVVHLNDCLAERDPADPYGCHGNAYDVALDPHGRITSIGEVAGS